MTTSVTAAKTGLCPGPRDFFRHENILKKPEKEKAEANNSSFFSLLPEYSSNGCVPAEPFSAFSGTVNYPMQGKKSNANRKISGLTSVATWLMIATTTRSQCLKNKNNQESSHE